MKAFVCLFVISFTIVSGKILDQCGIARELSRYGFQRWELADWTCLVMSESSGNTNIVGGPNSDGSHDYGFFQINDRYWCEHGRPGKECNVDCNALINDDIGDDVQCARKIQGIHGLDAWYGWQNKCKGGRSPNVDHCF